MGMNDKYEQVKDKLVRIIQEMALEIKPAGEYFTLRSGVKSRFYLDIRRVSLHDDGLHYIVECMWDCLSHLSKNERFQAIGGPCVGADPIVGGLLHMAGFFSRGNSNYRGFLVRKEEKTGHGKPERIIGSIKPTDHCLLIEDVCTSGTTTMETVQVLKDFGCSVGAVMCVVDRNGGARELFEQNGIKFYPLLTLADVVEPKLMRDVG